MGIQTDHEDLVPFENNFPIGDEFTGGNFRPHLSYQYADFECDVDETSDDGRLNAVHGTHTMGIVAATPDNGLGTTGVCWHCPLVLGSFYGDHTDGQAATATVAQALTEAADKGAQIASMSFGIADSCPPSSGNFGSEFLCDALDQFAPREILFLAASGNDLVEVELPAIHEDVVAVGAIETDGTHWTRLDQDCDDNDECGSNFSQNPANQTLDLVAPGQFVLSTVYTGEGYEYPLGYDDGGCGDEFPDDSIPGNDADGYGACTGTSMSSPYIAGALALLRTANPLLTRDQLRQILQDHASLADSWDPKLGYGLPDVAASMEATLGRVDGELVTNRATPMFRLHSAVYDTHLFTSSPQAAIAEIEGVGGGDFDPDLAAPLVTGFPALPGDTQPAPRAPFWLFT
ncbi:MAG: S8 family serine peptidase, partial [Thermoanaerobaculia bacterium]|nr:S8 family serine peptidase [Thermoanaerobaculia bacterium]